MIYIAKTKVSMKMEARTEQVQAELARKILEKDVELDKLKDKIAKVKRERGSMFFDYTHPKQSASTFDDYEE